jgi:ABC-2 type transport system permease protein
MVHTLALSGLFGVMNAVDIERDLGTLNFLIATPANRLVAYSGKAMVQVLDGLLSFLILGTIAFLYFKLSMPSGALPGFALSVCLVSFSLAGMGFLMGGLSLIFRESTFVANLLYWGVLVFGGVLFPIERLPKALQLLSQIIPLTHGLQAIRILLGQVPPGPVATLWAVEFVCGLTYFTLGAFVFAWLENRARRLATAELV